MGQGVPRQVATNRRKQLLFDRRYGWVYEEWTDPVEVANMGGRGMFSLVPLTAAALDGTLYLANLAADAIVGILQSHQSSRFPFQVNQTAKVEQPTQVAATEVPATDVSVGRTVAPTSVKFPRR